MQLIRKRKGRVRERIGALSAGLLAATVAGHSELADAQALFSTPGYSQRNDNFGPGVSYSELNAALLVYQEAGGRVGAVEPTLDLSAFSSSGDAFNLDFVVDLVSGATPNGAVPSNQPQTLHHASEGARHVGHRDQRVRRQHGHSSAADSGQIAAAASAIHRRAQHASRRQRVLRSPRRVQFRLVAARRTRSPRWDFGGGYSLERDYQAITGNVRMAQNFNANNTTLSVAVNYGTRFLVSLWRHSDAVCHRWTGIGNRCRSRRQDANRVFVAGITEVMTRQLAHAAELFLRLRQSGYQNDPYRIISVVDPTSGEPTSSLYESRPGTSRTQSKSFTGTTSSISARSVTDRFAPLFQGQLGHHSRKPPNLSERVDLTSLAVR